MQQLSVASIVKNNFLILSKANLILVLQIHMLGVQEIIAQLWNATIQIYFVLFNSVWSRIFLNASIG